MKTTKRTIATSVKTSAVYQQILADKQALRDKCANMNPATGLFSNDTERFQSVSVR